LASRLDELGIAYATLGTFALFHHGFRQYMEGIDVLVARDGAERLDQLSPGFCKAVNDRQWIDVETCVSVRFVLEGEPPSGVAWKSIRFPDPRTVSELDEGIRIVNLPTLVSIMLAAWLGNGRSTRDLANTQELIRARYLSESLAEQLHPDVRAAYLQICNDVNNRCGDYLKLWPLPANVPSPASMDELLAVKCPSDGELEAMQRDGIVLFPTRPYYDHHAVLSTSNRIVAQQYDMHHESEYLFKD
jgi:hypothetical protein